MAEYNAKEQALIARLAEIDGHLAAFPPDGSMPITEGLIAAERARLAKRLERLRAAPLSPALDGQERSA